MKIRSRSQRKQRFIVGTIGLVASLASAPPVVSLLLSSRAHAQTLEDTIESELDKMNSVPAPAPAPAPAPGPAPTAKANAAGTTGKTARTGEEDLTLDSAQPSEVAAPAPPAPAAPAAPEPSAAPEPPPVNANAPEPESFPTASEPTAMPSDAPNVDLEKRLYRIFKNQEPVSSARWTQLLGNRREDTYRVQAGDTLWDISRTMFGDGFFWSKLWAENGGLENPHKISPGRGVRFTAGSEASAPTVSVTDGPISQEVVSDSEKNSESSEPEERDTIRMNAFHRGTGRAPLYREDALKEVSPEELAAGQTVEVDELLPRPELPPPTIKSRPLLRKLPSSFVSNKIPRAELYDKTGLDAGKRPSYTKPAMVVPNTLIADRPLKGIGQISEVEDGDKVASIGQIVFVTMERQASAGEKLAVVLPKGMIEAKNTPKGRGEIGPVVEVCGMIEIVGPVEGHQGQYKAVVILSANPVVAGATVIQDPLPKIDMVRTGTMVTKEFQVIGGEFEESRKVLGQNGVLFLSGGSQDGLNVGDLLGVQSRRGTHYEDTKMPNYKRTIGLIKIVKVEPTVATAIILESLDVIRVGDITGGVAPENLGSVRQVNIETDL